MRGRKLDLPSLRRYFSRIGIRKVTLLKNRDFIVVFGLVMTLLVPCSFAQETTPPAGEDLSPQERAEKLALDGKKLLENGQYLEAAAKFRESLKLHPITAVYYNLAYSHDHLGEWQKCVTNYKLYIEAYKKEHNGTDPPDIISVNRSIEKCKVIAQPPISITSTPEGAQVARTEKHNIIGTTPLTLKLDPGKYIVFLSKAGYVPKKAQIHVLPKQPQKFHFDLAKVIKTGTITITVNVRDATIYIDGKNVGITPYQQTLKREIGTHQIVVKKERYTSINQTFVVKESLKKDLNFKLFLIDPTPSWRSYLGWTGVTIGVVSIAGGIIAYRLAEEEFSDTELFKDLQLYQNLGYSIGGSMLSIGISLLIWEAVRDAVDSDDLVRESAGLPFHIGFVPAAGGGHFYGTVRF